MTTAAELGHLFRSLKAPAAARALPKLAERARAEEWSYERFAEALLASETSSREAHGGDARIRSARFPGRKTLDEFDWSFQRSVKRELVLHLAQLDFLLGKENVVLLGPPGTGKTHLAIAIGIRACLAGHRTAFATASEWVARLLDAQHQGRLSLELRRLGRVPLVIVDEIGYVPFDPEAAKLMFHLVSSRYERASLIVTSNKPFSAWGEVFGDDVVATAMVDRLCTTPRSSRSRATATGYGAKTSLQDVDQRRATRPRGSVFDRWRGVSFRPLTTLLSRRRGWIKPVGVLYRHTPITFRIRLSESPHRTRTLPRNVQCS